VISDGNDTSSHTDVQALRQRIRETEVLVYAIGIDTSGSAPSAFPNSGASGASTSGAAGNSGTAAPRKAPVPTAFPGAPVIITSPSPSNNSSSSPARRSSGNNSERFNVDALRLLTDDSGGRTEVIYSERDLDPATAGIASELSRQYFIGYSTTVPKDGRWHTIEVRLKRGNYTIRARRGFVAS